MKPVQVHLSNEQRRSLAQIARARGASLSDTLRRLIAEEHDRTSRVSDAKPPPENETDDAPTRAP
jgi:macrodomain Ter protein organizer (MatP/YcbG family)